MQAGKKTRSRLRVLLAVLLLGSLLILPASAGTVDATYYNTGVLSPAEAAALTGLPKGAVVVMTPTSGTFYTGETARQMILSGEVQIISVAGVGSSSVGTAAFAKHIARIKSQPVAGIVVGYGDGSVYTEGPEGYYIGRPSNVAGVWYEEPASRTLAELYEAGARPQLLVGHSKGNMDIANALFKLAAEGHCGWYAGTDFKTFGCGVNVPAGLKSFRQYIGTLDSLGYANTVSWAAMTYVYGRYHTTNPYYALTYMPIENYL